MTRRSVVRVGVAAAWTAPLVQVIAAAPAQAVGSGVSLNLSGTFTHASGNRNVTLTGGSITNNGTQSTSSLQITVTLTSSGTQTLSGTSVNTTPSGWSAGSGSFSGSSGNWSGTFVFTKTTQLAANGSSSFAPVFRLPNNNSKDSAGSGTATATSTGASPDVVTNSYNG